MFEVGWGSYVIWYPIKIRKNYQCRANNVLEYLEQKSCF